MAEENFDPEKEGRRIVAGYLSGLGWTREWRRTITGEVRPAWSREDREDKFRQADQMEEQAEEAFSKEIERLRKDPSKEATLVMRSIVKLLENRTDLTFLGKSIVGHLKRELERRR
ncbi:MAG: hypothetical protein NT030_07245 [Candidatus Saganbacteria bacterium]|nr:hypothetical protein [Candidatus Saganbacteria bacterium]